MIETGMLAAVTMDLASQSEVAVHMGSGTSMAPLMLKFIVQLGVIIIAARLGGVLLKRVLKLPGVLGELVTGMIISPYALGGWNIPGLGQLFALPTDALPISPELYAIATLASIVLLFLSGLETDLSTFLRYSVVGTAVGVGGVVFSFTLGDMCAVWFGMASSFFDPPALFLGTISTATSVGITARILSEKRKFDTPEGVTILAGAVFDDVLGIIVLAIVVGMARVEKSDGIVEWHHVAGIALKALGFWIGCMTAGLLLARRFSSALKMLKSTEVIASVAFGLALLLAGLSEMAGLAMIIGAYIMGLSLSRTDLVQVIQHEIQGLHNSLVPVFFCVMGMMVNVTAIHGMILMGLVYSVLAIASKLLGCGLPAWFMKFNLLGACRIGVGMVPRGEVALIVAGIGLSTGAIGSDVFGVAIMMTMLTTLLSPGLMAHLFDIPKSGLRRAEDKEDSAHVPISLSFPSPDMAEFFRNRLTNAFRKEEFFVYRLSPDIPSYQIRKDDMFFSLTQEGDQLVLVAARKHEHIARFILFEEILAIQDMFNWMQKMQDLDSMGRRIITEAFNGQ
ncbi:MAG: cation:proton antiporter [Lentisphaerota bacterium]